jgi:hypothetical protein
MKSESNARRPCKPCPPRLSRLSQSDPFGKPVADSMTIRMKRFAFSILVGVSMSVEAPERVAQAFLQHWGLSGAMAGLQVAQLAAHYDIDVEGDLADVLPRLEEGDA